jgi:uncharacterized protein (TIGR02271 family)
MTTTIVGTFRSIAEAEAAATRLEAAGVARRQIEVLDSDTARAHEQRSAGERGSGGGFWSWLFGDVESDRGRGFPEEDAGYFSERIRSGEAMVIVTTDERDAERVRGLLDRGGAETVEPRSETAARGGERVMPVVEEEMRIGKRSVERGGVRVYRHVSERPIEEHLRLREERIRVERRPVDRPLRAAPGGAFEEETIELTETAEEPVVEKRARIVEEVAIGKDVQSREETVRDKVRRSDVEVERTGGGFAAMEPDFRRHCTTTLGGGLTYEQCSPAYRYGYESAQDARYRGDWNAVESDMRRDWETRQPGTWDRFKSAIRYAWDRARGTARAA